MTKSTAQPMELIERYLQAVRFWMPTGQRDLVVELAEDLHSQVEEKEAEVGRPLDEGEVAAILKRCGSPIVVAGRLRPQQFLIGPTLFPVYRFVLKMVLLWILVPVFTFYRWAGALGQQRQLGSSDRAYAGQFLEWRFCGRGRDHDCVRGA